MSVTVLTLDASGGDSSGDHLPSYSVMMLVMYFLMRSGVLCPEPTKVTMFPYIYGKHAVGEARTRTCARTRSM